ncbi:18243_t:CDS:1, partial [Funneliformis geosporum]
TIVSQGDCKNPLDSKIEKYAYKEKVKNHKAQRIIEDDRDTLAKWLYTNA